MSGGSPTLTDYFAGAMLANGTVWIWSQLLYYFPNPALQLLSFAIYVLGATASSYLVSKRASHGHLIAGLKTAGVSWLFSIFFIIAYVQNPNPWLAIVLLVCFAIGGFGGSYLALRSILKAGRAEKAASKGAEESLK